MLAARDSKMMVKVCFLGGTRYSRPLDRTHARKLALLSELAHIYVVGFARGLKPHVFYEHAHLYLLPRCPLPVLRYLTLLAGGMLLALWLNIRHGVEILVAQSPYEGFGAACAKILARWLGRQIVVVVESHGDFEISLFLQRRVPWPGLYRWMMKRAARIAFREADIMRAVSNSTAKQLAAWAQHKPIVQFIAWTDLAPFIEAGDRHTVRHLEILYAGSVVPGKGIHYLIRALARIAPHYRDLVLTIIGRQENRSYACALRRLAADLGVDKRTQFLDHLSQEELAARIRNAAVFVLPSLSEGLPRVVLEAMATGTPVVASNVAGVPEVIHHGVNGILCPQGDESALAERLHELLANPVEARCIGARAREFVASFFSTDVYLEGYRNILALSARKLGLG